MASFVGRDEYKGFHQIFRAGSNDQADSRDSAPQVVAVLSGGLQCGKPWVIYHRVTMVQGCPFSRHRRL